MNVEDKLILTLTSEKKNPMRVKIMIHHLTDDVSDMPIYQNEYTIYKGTNYIVINLKNIGTGKYSLRVYYKDKIIDYRIVEIVSKNNK